MMDHGPMSPYQCGVPVALTAGCRPPPSAHMHTQAQIKGSFESAPLSGTFLCNVFIFTPHIVFIHNIKTTLFSSNHPHPSISPQNTLFSLLLCVLALYFLPNPPSYECVVRVSASAHAGGNDTVSASGQLSDTPDLLRSIPDVYTDVSLLYTQGGKWLCVSSFQYKRAI